MFKKSKSLFYLINLIVLISILGGCTTGPNNRYEMVPNDEVEDSTDYLPY